MMPLFMCSRCGSVENTATSGYWSQQHHAHASKTDFAPLCSACNPALGQWHGLFPRRSAQGYKQDRLGFLYTADEAVSMAAHMGPFKDVVLPDAIAAPSSEDAA